MVEAISSDISHSFIHLPCSVQSTVSTRSILLTEPVGSLRNEDEWTGVHIDRAECNGIIYLRANLAER